MGYLQDLLAIDHLTNLEFFTAGLKDAADGEVLDEQELLYSASILAHNAMVSCQDGAFHQSDMRPFSNLSEFFDVYFLIDCRLDDPELWEFLGAQSLFLCGFFSDQMKRRHKLRWYADLGQMSFQHASRLSEKQNKAQLLEHMSRRFRFWLRTYCALSRNCRLGLYRYMPIGRNQS